MPDSTAGRRPDTPPLRRDDQTTTDTLAATDLGQRGGVRTDLGERGGVRADLGERGGVRADLGERGGVRTAATTTANVTAKE